MKKSYVFIVIGLVILILLIFLGIHRNKSTQKKHYSAINKSFLSHALAYGEKNAGLPMYEFVKPWTINLGYRMGKGYATLLTPFLRLALLERESVLNNEKLDTFLENKVYNQETSIIHFLVTMYGNSPRFSQRIKVFLLYNKQVIKPSFIYFPSYNQMGRDYTQISNGEIKFSRNNIPDSATVTLVVKIEPVKSKSNPAYKYQNTTFWEKNHTAKFKFTLAKYQ